MKQLPYNDYGSTMRRKFGGRIQKLALDAGLSCPNRDGTIAYGGCTFCLGEAFSPSYCRNTNTLTNQIDSALRFHNNRGRKAESYLAYLQAGTNTHASIEELRKIYNEITSHPAISGIIIGTRPDCINSEILQLFHDISKTKYIAVEYGIESVYDTTLQHINRGHNFATAAHAVTQTKVLGIDVGAHFIIGLPNESVNNIVDGVKHINSLGIDFIKFHQLQIYASTAIEREWRENPEHFIFSHNFNIYKYTHLITEIIRRLEPHIAIERIVSQAPHHLIAHSPLGGIRPDKVRNMVVNYMNTNSYRQGDIIL